MIANRLFKSIEELEELLNRLLNQGELVINWGRKLKNVTVQGVIKKMSYMELDGITMNKQL
jgi:hypothetical protein